MLDSNSNSDGVEITIVEVEGMEVVWIGVGVVCTDCAVSVGFVEAIDLGSDTMKDFGAYQSVQQWWTSKNKQMREREKKR